MTFDFIKDNCFLVTRRVIQLLDIPFTKEYIKETILSHPDLDSLYKEGKINLQIIFTSSLSKDDFRTPPAKHLLALYHQYDKDKVQTLEALEAWYKAKVKDYSVFSKQFTIDKGALDSQDKNIEKMYEW